jgi:hypothetical protein
VTLASAAYQRYGRSASMVGFVEPFSHYNRLASRWGMSPHEFNPSRWLDGETNQGDAVGPYTNLYVIKFISNYPSLT